MTATLLSSARRTSTGSTYLRSTEQLVEFPRTFGTGGTVLPSAESDILFDFFLRPSRTSTFGIFVQAIQEVSTSRALHEIRLKTGLTWDQLSKIFHVDRRSLHFWASGKALSAIHEEQLFRLLKVFRRIDRGSARENRAILLNPLGRSNQTPFEKLVSGDFDGALSLVDSSQITRRRSPVPSAEQVADRLPSSPFSFDGDIDDSPLPTSGLYRASKRVRIKRGDSA
jgi:hypothetical protein